MDKPLYLQICANRSTLYTHLWEGMQDMGLTIQSFHFSHEELGLPEKGSPFDKEYIISTLPFQNRDRLSFFLKEKKIYRSLVENIDVSRVSMTHAHTLFTDGYLAYRLKKSHQIPYIVAVRSTDLLFFRLRFYLRGLGRKILKEAEAVVFLSASSKREVLDRYVSRDQARTLEEKSHILYNGIAPVFLENRPEDPKRFGKDREFKILTVGNIEDNKNQILVCQGLSQLEKSRPLSYRIIGKVRDADYAKKLFAYPFVQIEPPKAQEDLIKDYRAADLFVLLSKRETFGLVYGEAMSQGLPVIYTQGQGFDGLFQEGEVGYHASSRDPQDLVRTIDKILINYEKRSQTCMDQAHCFDWERICHAYVDLYQGIMI